MESVIEVHSSISSIEEEWRELAREARTNPFLHPEWSALWWEAWGKGSLKVFALRNGGRLRAVLPMHLRHWELASLTNWHTPAFGFLGAGNTSISELTEKLFEDRRSVICLDFVDPNDCGLAVFGESARAANYRVLLRSLQRSPYIALHDDWPRYQNGLSKKLRSELRRRRKRLGEIGELRLEIVNGERELEARLEEAFGVEAAGWKGVRGTAMTSHTATRTFYSGAARWAAGAGFLRLAFLRLDNRAIAFDYCFELDGTHYLVKTGYDPAFEKYGPGMLLRNGMLERAFAIGLNNYEFLGDDAPWKRAWADSCRDRLRVQAFSPSVLGTLERVAHTHGRPLAKEVLRSYRKVIGAHGKP